MNMAIDSFVTHLDNNGLSNPQNSVQQGFCHAAAATERLADENAELQQYLLSNADLIKKLEREVLHAESLSIQLLHAQQAC